jgi:hypothetical protein
MDSEKGLIASATLMHRGSYGFFRDPGCVDAARAKLYISSIRLYGAFLYLQDYKNYGNHRLP